MRKSNNPKRRYIPSEYEECKLLADYLNLKRIPFMHIPNEGKRSLIIGSQLKRIGLQPGFPDYIIFRTPPKDPEKKGIIIEMKRRKGGNISENQEKWIRILRDDGYIAFIAKGAHEAIMRLQELGL